MKKDIVLLGGLLLDRYFYIDRWPARGQDGFLEREESFVGGCSINMAATIHNLGGQAYIATCIGEDAVGQTILDHLEQHGLSRRLVHTVAGTSGSCIVFSEPEGERTFLTHKGAECVFTPALAQDLLMTAPAWAGVTGYYLLGDHPEDIMSCLEGMHRGGTRFLFDPSPLVTDIAPDILARMVQISAILTPNGAELAPFGGAEGLRDLIGAGKTIILTRGAEGGTVYTPAGDFDYASAPCTVADTTGAGDSFSGALLYAMTEGWPMEVAIDLAARCAARTCEINGPHGFWTLDERE
ncbi:MAG: carbohydrate kinase family protein [Ruminiclostridium sp.]|nr:carbohydrate kinase family protein [Ruminiclostridium sp.]